MEIDVANTKIENGYMHKYLPLTFFVANVEWLMRNYKDRQFIIFGEFRWRVNKDSQSEYNEDGVCFHEIISLAVDND